MAPLAPYQNYLGSEQNCQPQNILNVFTVNNVGVVDICNVFCAKSSMNGEEIYREIGRRIRRFRKAAGQTQDQLADRIDLSRASIANIEAGRQHFLIHYVYSIAAALNLDTPLPLLPGAHEVIAPSTDMAKVPVQQKDLTDKQLDDVLRVMGGGDPDGSTTGGRR